MTKPSKILLLNTTIARGGSERNLVNYALELKDNGIEVSVWYLYGSQQDYRELLVSEGIQVRCFDLRWRFSFSGIIKVASTIATTDADLIHIFLPSIAYYYVVARWVFRLRKPTVYSCGSTAYLLPFERMLTRHVLAKVCYPLIGNSESVSEFLQCAGAPLSHIRVIPNGHDIDAYNLPFDRLKFRIDHGLPVDARIVISVGRLIASKRHADLIEAFSEIVSKQDNLRLVLVGEGDMRETLASLSKRLQIEEKVHFFGLRSDVVNCLRAADIFAFPTESEGLPNALIEASLAGLPIVASDIQPNYEVVSADESALVYPTGNWKELCLQLKRLLNDPVLAEQLAVSARKSAISRYSLAASMEKLLMAYHDALHTSLPYQDK